MSASDHLLIINFIGPKPKWGSLKPWLEFLNNVAKHGQVFFNHVFGFGFFYLKCDTQETIKQVSMQTPFSNDMAHVSSIHGYELSIMPIPQV